MIENVQPSELQKNALELVLKILQQKTVFYKKIWDKIDNEMKKSMSLLAKELELGFLKSKFMKFYWWYVSRKMIEIATSGGSIVQIEEEINKITSKISNDNIKLPFLRNRADRAYIQISSYIKGSRICDLGCGDGMLAGLIQQDYEVITADVLDYRAEENKNTEFILLEQDQPIQLQDNSVDTTILWTVLHHSEDPEFLLREATRITSSRIIIVEGYINDLETKTINCFYDWYFNRPGKGIDVNVPFNYQTTNEWLLLFSELGWEVEHEQYLGIDEPIVPERHILYVIKPKQN